MGIEWVAPVHGYYWLFPDSLAGGRRPGGPGRDNSTLDADLRWLAQLNLRAILTLTEDPLPPEALERAGLTALHLPVRDLTAPTAEQLVRALDFIDQSQASGSAVYVHCLMGQGRTGTVLAAYLVRAGFSPDAAIQRIRDLQPGSIEMPEQERAVTVFARRRDWVI
jgi:atypical dual specificity phosphatase